MSEHVLFDRHREELVGRSAIDLELACLNFRSVRDTESTLGGDASAPIDEFLGKGTRRFCHKARPNESGWICQGVEPLTGEDMPWGRYKPDVPRSEIRDGKERLIKYESPHGVPSRGTFMKVPRRLAQKVADRYGVKLPEDYRPEDFWKWVIKNNLPVLLCEGEKKAACLLSRGYAAIGLPGINSGYRVKDSLGNPAPRQLIPDLVPFATPGREIYICFDVESDPQTARKVATAAKRTGELFAKAGCTVKFIQLPGPEKGVDDFVVAGGDFESLYEDAQALEQPEEKETRKSQADVAVELAMEGGAQFFHNRDGKCFADLSLNGHRETHSLKSQGFRAWLCRIYWESKNKSLNRQSVGDALGTLEGIALFNGSELETNVRMAHRDGKVFLDLGTPTCEVVEITATGWQIIPSTACPVRFIRTNGMKPHPMPERGGKLSDLRALLNVSDQGWILISSWLVACFSEGPYCVLILGGEQGTAKTTSTRLLRDLVDPGKATARALPKEERDLAIAASNSWIISYDNVRHLLDWLSDAICRVSTGGGLGTRTLFADAEETIFDIRRPCILNGITNLATRGDLQDRSLNVPLEVIPEDQRIEERAFLERFEKIRPSIFGALLDAVAVALSRRSQVKLPRKPRMADFAVFAAAAAPALGLAESDVIDALFENRSAATEMILEGSPIAQTLINFLAAQKSGEWTGTTGELLEQISSPPVPKGWPRTAKGLADELQRIAPTLRLLGIVWVDAGSNKHGKRLRTLRQTPKTTSATSATSAAAQGKGYRADIDSLERQPNVSQTSATSAAPTKADIEADVDGTNVSQTSALEPIQGKGADGADVADIEIPACNNGHCESVSEDEDDDLEGLL
jgi:hypothetical protein